MIEELTQLHRLTVVYTVVADTAVPRLAVMIAMDHVRYHGAEAVVVPHLRARDVWVGREWHALAELVDVVIADGAILRGGAIVSRTRIVRSDADYTGRI
ncbi:hypothetical protein [Nocardia sp. NPDC002869]|uniref:hypothetical protein n=1 Tax=Nocardia sp. NPDC002869 TaxID=3161032 RepID=UPI00398D5B65